MDIHKAGSSHSCSDDPLRHGTPGLWHTQTALPVLGQYLHRQRTSHGYPQGRFKPFCSDDPLRHGTPGLWHTQTALPVFGQYLHRQRTSYGHTQEQMKQTCGPGDTMESSSLDSWKQTCWNSQALDRVHTLPGTLPVRHPPRRAWP